MRLRLILLVFYLIFRYAANAIVPVVTIKKTNAVIIVDALNNELAWQGATVLYLTKKFKNESPTATIDSKILYDENHIYFYFTVIDDKVNYLSTHAWMGDKIELYFGLPGYTRGQRLLSDSHSRQFAFDADQDWFDDDTKTCYFSRNDILDWEGINLKNSDGCRYMFKETNTGYEYEIAINRKALQNIDFSTVESIGFDISLVDYDAEADLEIGDFWRNRYVWYNDGKLEFATENWAALDLGLLKFENTTSIPSVQSNSHVIISDRTLTVIGDETPNAIAVFNVQGQQIAYIDANAKQISLSSVNDGVYIIKVIFNNKVLESKVVLF